MSSIIKNKKKIFHIRRSKLKWIDSKNNYYSAKPLTIKQHIWKTINKNTNFKEKIFYNVYNLYYNNQTIRTNIIEKNNLFTSFMNYYLMYCYKLTKRFEIKKLNGMLCNLITITTPATQTFFTLSKSKPVLIFTPGVIRIVMKLLEKSAKKRKPVILNSIKFLWISSKNIFIGPLRLKISRNIAILNKLFNATYSVNRSRIEYIFYEPKLNFGIQNHSKRASIKKNLRKKKKYINE